MLNNLNNSKFKFISSCRAGLFEFEGFTVDVTVMHAGFISKDPLKNCDTNIVVGPLASKMTVVDLV